MTPTVTVGVTFLGGDSLSDNRKNQITVCVDTEINEKGLTELTGIGDMIQKFSDQFSDAFNKMNQYGGFVTTVVAELAVAVTNLTVALDGVEDALNNEGTGNMAFDGVSTAISALSLACDLFTGEKVLAFIKEGITGMPVMISNLAASTAGLISNAAAMVSNTVGQWAQIAATTAWNAICTTATAVTRALGAAMNFLTSPIALVVVGITALIAIIVLLITNWDTVKEGLITGWETVKSALGTAAEWFDTTIIQPVAELFGGLWDGIVGFASDAWAAIQGVFGAVAQFFGDIFSEAWANVVGVFSAAGDIFNDIVGGVSDFFIEVVNGLIDGINAVVAVPFDGINFALGTVRDMEIFGITPFDGLKTIDVPKIPYLAQGAVLPANKPFLAMVGDQRHGTNVEAPLAVIQEAVAAVMGDVVASNMAGHEATVAVLREILSAVLGIEIGDEVIGRAAQRYDARMAVIRGVR